MNTPSLLRTCKHSFQPQERACWVRCSWNSKFMSCGKSYWTTWTPARILTSKASNHSMADSYFLSWSFRLSISIHFWRESNTAFELYLPTVALPHVHCTGRTDFGTCHVLRTALSWSQRSCKVYDATMVAINLPLPPTLACMSSMSVTANLLSHRTFSKRRPQTPCLRSTVGGGIFWKIMYTNIQLRHLRRG